MYIDWMYHKELSLPCMGKMYTFPESLGNVCFWGQHLKIDVILSIATNQKISKPDF